MKVHVVYDKEGKILSLGVPLPVAYDFRGPQFGPVAKEGQHVAELAIPEEHAGLHLLNLAERLRVDTREKPHRLVSKK